MAIALAELSCLLAALSGNFMARLHCRVIQDKGVKTEQKKVEVGDVFSYELSVAHCSLSHPLCLEGGFEEQRSNKPSCAS